MRQCQPFDQTGPDLIECSPQLVWTDLSRAGACHNNQIDTLQHQLVMTERFPHDTFEVITLYCKFEMFLGRDQAETARG